MAKHVSPAMIGAFVAGSFAILISAIVVVGSGRLLQKPERFVCMFSGNVNGLKEGAPVKFRGVQIGTVEDIRLRLSPAEGRLRADIKTLRLPVIINIEHSLIAQEGGTGQALTLSGFMAAIKGGLRAQLSTESLVTGLLYVDLDEHPNAPLDLALVPGAGSLREIPTVPTTMEAIQAKASEAIAKFDTIDFRAVTSSVTEAADSIKDLARSPSLAAAIDSLKQTAVSLDHTLASTKTTVDHLNANIDPLMASLRSSSAQANATMQELRAAIDPDAPLSVHLNQALEQLSDTTQSMGQMIDYLQRNPAALVRGKYVRDGR